MKNVLKKVSVLNFANVLNKVLCTRSTTNFSIKQECNNKTMNSFALKTVKIKTLHNFNWLSLSETKVNIGLEKGPESLIEIEHSLPQSGQAIYSLRPSTLAQ